MNISNAKMSEPVLKPKKIVLFIFLTLAAFSPTMLLLAQWIEQNSGVSAGLNDVCFADSLYGWAIGDSGTIISTTDGGKNWFLKYEQVDTIDFDKVQFFDGEKGFVGGNIITKLPGRSAYQPLLLRTNNGGLAWEVCTPIFDSEMYFDYMQFINSEIGLICINNIGAVSWEERGGLLLKTTDAGSSWDTLQEIKGLLNGAVIFNNEYFGYSFWSLAYDNYDDTEVYYTENAGLEWTLAGEIKEEIVLNAKFLAPNIIWTTGFNGIGRSTDGGQTWQHWNWFSPVPPGQKRFLPSDIEVISADEVWLLGNIFSSPYDGEGILLYTNNSGETWQNKLQLPGYSFSAFNIINNQKVWITNRNGSIIYNNNFLTAIGNQLETRVSIFDLKQNYPNPFNSTTSIEFLIPKPQFVSIKIFDVLGNEITTLVNEEKSAGLYSVTWDALNISSGVYFYRMQTDAGFIQTRKLILLK